MKLLFLSRWYPYPVDNGSKIRIYNLLKSLATQHEVDLISFSESELTPEQIEAMQSICRQVSVTVYRPFQPSSLKASLALFSPKPRSVIDTYNEGLANLVDQAARKTEYDAVIASQIDMVPYAQRLSATPKILEEIELTTQYEQQVNETNAVKKIRKRLMWWKYQQYVRTTLSQFAGCTVVSAAEKSLVSQVAGRGTPIAVIPNGVDCAHYAAEFGNPQMDRLVYTGALSYRPNLDAMQFFISQILPLIQAQRPAVQLSITGKANPDLTAQLPNNPNFRLTGYLEDIRPTIAQSWLTVVPLRLGGGTRLKILESLAAGTPVVSTSKGAEGLDLTPDQDLLIADTPTEFAEAVLRLLNDVELRSRLSQQGRNTVSERYDWSMIGQQLQTFISQQVT